ncbi:MAG: DUF1538 domain-containing protein [Candidatus Saccharicenans sp.]|nr:DUF1538 domain-containing protein [Candidatus Saccharicenans sp.]
MKEANKRLSEVIQAVLPIVILVLILQFTFLSLPLVSVLRFLIGSVMVMAGMLLFLHGARISLLPIGEAIGAELPQKMPFAIILIASCIIGLVVTMAEPDVRVLAFQVDLVSGGEINRSVLILAVALGVGIAVSLAILRIFLGINIAIVLLAGYIAVLILSFFVPPELVPVAFDAGGVTTGPITVPFILSLGIGVVSVLGGKSAIKDGFGIIGIASIGPIVSVMLLGIIYR